MVAFVGCLLLGPFNCLSVAGVRFSSLDPFRNLSAAFVGCLLLGPFNWLSVAAVHFSLICPLRYPSVAFVCISVLLLVSCCC